MKGSNEIHLNQITMQEVVQHYLDNVLFAEGKSPKVDEVRRDPSQTYAHHFIVQLKEREQEARDDG
jgi:phage-related protein